MTKLILGVISLVAIFGVYFGGHWVGYSASKKEAENQAMYIDVLNAATNYVVFSDMRRKMVAGASGEALCSVDLIASASVLRVKACLGKDSCREMVLPKIMDIAPELSKDGADLNINFYEPGKMCAPK